MSKNTKSEKTASFYKVFSFKINHQAKTRLSGQKIHFTIVDIKS